MGLLDSLLGGGGRPAGAGLADRVIMLRQQGMDDSFVIQQLQKEGASMSDIQNAMMQADIKMRVAGQPQGGAQMPPGQMPPQGPMMQQGQMPPPQMEAQQMPPQGMLQQMPYPTGAPGPEQPFGPPQVSPPGYPSDFERILDERLSDILKRVDELDEERSKIRNDIADMKEVVSDLKGKYMHIQEESSVKLEEYSKELESVGAHIKALERVLQRVFSATAQNMRELSEIVKSMKGRMVGAPATAAKPLPRSLSEPTEPSPERKRRSVIVPVEPEEQ